jgi:hypothetical protein
MNVRRRAVAALVAAAALTATAGATAGTAGAAPTVAVTRSATAVPMVGVVSSTTLPSRVEVGSDITTVPFTVTTTVPAISVIVRLRNYAGKETASVTVTNGVESTKFSGRISFSDTALPSLGAYTFNVQPLVRNQPNLLSTEVHTLLGLAPLTRSGNVIGVVGSLRIYDTIRHTYLRWTGRPVQLQRYSSDGFVTIKPLTTDRYGDVHTTVSIPFRVGLRLVTPETPTAFVHPSNSEIA